MLRVRKSLDKPANQRFRCPFTICFTFFFTEPRATPWARFALGAAFFRAARFTFLRSCVSVTFFVFILVVQALSFLSSPFEARVFLHQFLQSVIPELHHQLRVVAIAFPANNLADAVSGVSY